MSSLLFINVSFPVDVQAENNRLGLFYLVHTRSLLIGTLTDYM